MLEQMVRVKINGQSKSLRLKRAPKYLRFCVKPGRCGHSQEVDALDLLEDEADPRETLYAAILVERGTMHLDMVEHGRRVGKWYDTAEYRLLDPQPEDAVMRDNSKWQAFCYAEHAKSQEAVGS